MQVLKPQDPHFFGKKFAIISWNRLIIFNGDVKCVLLISFIVQNLITSDNPISMWLWWIWNSAFWLEVENLRKLANPFPVFHRKTETSFPQTHQQHNWLKNVYIFLDFELYLCKSKEFNNKQMKVQVKRALKSYFLSPKT